jgi:hypothetical protein
LVTFSLLLLLWPASAQAAGEATPPSSEISPVVLAILIAAGYIPAVFMIARARQRLRHDSEPHDS